MHPVFADPKTDLVFMRIFGAEPRKHLLIALLNDLLELEDNHRILNLQHLSFEPHIACADQSGRRFIVEMELLKTQGFEQRIVFNLSKAYITQPPWENDLPTLRNIVGVTICDFLLWPEKDDGGQFKVPMLSRLRMQEQHSGALGIPQMQLTLLELPKYAAGADPQTRVEKWAYFFREARNLDAVPPALSEPPFREALDVARTATFGPAE